MKSRDKTVNIMENDKMSMALKVDFELLKTNLNAIYEKDGEKNESTILVIPTKTENPESVKIGEIVEAFKSLSGGDPTENISGTIGSLSDDKDSNGFSVDNIAFTLHAAYLYKKTAAEDKDSVTEYAFAIAMDLSEAMPKFPLGTINSISLAIWNTKREGVLANMNMGSAAKLLAAIS